MTELKDFKPSYYWVKLLGQNEWAPGLLFEERNGRGYFCLCGREIPIPKERFEIGARLERFNDAAPEGLGQPAPVETPRDRVTDLEADATARDEALLNQFRAAALSGLVAASHGSSEYEHETILRACELANTMMKVVGRRS